MSNEAIIKFNTEVERYTALPLGVTDNSSPLAIVAKGSIGPGYSPECNAQVVWHRLMRNDEPNRVAFTAELVPLTGFATRRSDQVVLRLISWLLEYKGPHDTREALGIATRAFVAEAKVSTVVLEAAAGVINMPTGSIAAQYENSVGAAIVATFVYCVTHGADALRGEPIQTVKDVLAIAPGQQPGQQKATPLARAMRCAKYAADISACRGRGDIAAAAAAEAKWHKIPTACSWWAATVSAVDSWTMPGFQWPMRQVKQFKVRYYRDRRPGVYAASATVAAVAIRLDVMPPELWRIILDALVQLEATR